MTWIFGYGSLMWNPGFAYSRRRPAILNGYHRVYMMYSTRNRGTPASPGMLVSLAPGQSCTGQAMLIEPGREKEALAYLDKREGLGRAHRRVMVPIHLVDDGAGPAINAWTYLPILTYSNCIWGVPTPRQAELVARGRGKIGSSYDYLRRMLDELAGMNVSEPMLEQLFQRVQQVRDGNSASPAAPPLA